MTSSAGGREPAGGSERNTVKIQLLGHSSSLGVVEAPQPVVFDAAAPRSNVLIADIKDEAHRWAAAGAKRLKEFIH